jgi:hypothetical protein
MKRSKCRRCHKEDFIIMFGYCQSCIDELKLNKSKGDVK